MSKFSKNPSGAPAPLPRAATVVVPPAKRPALPAGKTPATSPASASTPSQTEANPTDSEAIPNENTSSGFEERSDEDRKKADARAPRDPHGHKILKWNDIFEAAHKTKFLPLADGQFTGNLFFQPTRVVECSNLWCEVEMVEMVYGSTICYRKRVFSVDCEDLLRMLYLHAMAVREQSGGKRVFFENWVLSIYEDYSATHADAEFSQRGPIAKHYLESTSYDFCMHNSNVMQMFFQKRCIRDIQDVDEATCVDCGANVNVIRGKALKGKFEYQIEGHIYCVPGLHACVGEEEEATQASGEGEMA